MGEEVSGLVCVQGCTSDYTNVNCSLHGTYREIEQRFPGVPSTTAGGAAREDSEGHPGFCEPCGWRGKKNPAITWAGVDNTPVCRHHSNHSWYVPIAAEAEAAYQRAAARERSEHSIESNPSNARRKEFHFPPMDNIRDFALKHALEFHNFRGGNATPDQIVATAETFLEFLVGRPKKEEA